MEIPQPLPFRSVRLETDDPDALGAAQPERRRRCEQLARGPFRGEVIEQGFGRAAVHRESWSCGVRVRCDRPSGYVAFAVPVAPAGDVTWCGRALAPDHVMRIDEPWEISTAGVFDFAAFAVDSSELEAAQAQLAGGEGRAAPPGNALVRVANSRWLAERLQHLLRVLDAAASQPAALQAAAADLLHLAAALERGAGRVPVERPSSPSQRRGVVRRIEEYLDAHRGEAPSIPTLCSVAGVSERTLEYAFRELIGVTPVRYLKLRRLNLVRRALRAPEAGASSVTEIALRAGFYDLGRFAGEYRALFGELPSQTLAACRIRAGVARPEGSALSLAI
jgi:AraC family ethanolamine operon transcriptional activator